MDGNITIKYLQKYLKATDAGDYPVRKDWFVKLSEEVGELARAIRSDATAENTGSLKGSVDEEIWDVIYYAIGLANCYGIDLEDVIPKKFALSAEKYPKKIEFGEEIPD